MSQHKTKKPSKRNWVSLVIYAFVLCSLIAAGYFGWKTYTQTQQKTQLLTAIEQQKQTLLQLEQEQNIGARMRAANILKKAQENRTNWSEVYKDFNETFVESSQIKFSSVNIDKTGRIIVQGEAPDLLSAASFLLLVKRSDLYENGFINQLAPSGITTGGPVGSGNRSYRFSASVDYSPQDES